MTVRDVQAVVEQGVARALEAGEVGLGVAVYHRGELVADACGGIADQETGRPVDADTVFWIASVSKALVATALHIQVERGLVEYERPIADYWPAFGVHGKERATVLDALMHRAGVPIFPMTATPELMCDYAWVAEHIASAHPIYAPGTQNAYHAHTFGYLLGEVIRASDPQRRPLRDFIHDELFAPLGADALWFGIPEEVEPRVARYYYRPEPGAPAGYGHDTLIATPAAVASTNNVFNRADVHRACMPSAGAIGDARSLGKVFAMLAGGGELGGVRLLSPGRSELFRAPRPDGWDLVAGDGRRCSMGGFWIPHSDGDSAPMGDGPGVFGHPGSAGNLAFCDVDHDLAVAFTANRFGTGRRSAAENPLVPLADAIRASLGIG